MPNVARLLIILFSFVAAANADNFVRVEAERATVYSVPGFNYRNWQIEKPDIDRLGFPPKYTLLKINPGVKPKQVNGAVYLPVIYNGEAGWVEENYVQRVASFSGCTRCKGKVETLSEDLGKILISSESEFPYQTCTAKNGYYETGFKKAPFTDMPLIKTVNPACTYKLLEMGQNANFRRKRCTKSNTRGKPPCLSSNYHKAVHNAFVVGAKCMGLDPRPLIGKYGTESKFQIDAYSSTGAIGVSQLTNAWIKDMRHSYRDQYLSELSKNDDPLCQRMYGIVSKAEIRSGQDCTAVSPPENPLLSFFYGFVYAKQAQRELAQILFDSLKGKATEKIVSLRARLSILRSEENSLHTESKILSPNNARVRKQEIKQRLKQIKAETAQISNSLIPELKVQAIKQNPEAEKILNEASTYAYNIGIPGMKVYLRSFFAKPSNQKINYAQFGSANGRFIRHLETNLGSDIHLRRRDEILNYVHTYNAKGSGGESSVSGVISMVNQAVKAKHGLHEEEPCAGF